MEKPSVNPVNKVELPKTEQSVEHFSLSEQEKNIREIFKLSPELKTIANDSLGIEDDKDIVIELGRNKENTLGKIQNINVYYKGEKIINSDGQDSSKLYLVTKEDGTSYVGDIFIPTELQGQGLGKKILQKVSDTLDTKIAPNYLSTGGFTSDNAKKMWEKIGNEILPNHEAEKLYAEYLKTIFPESKYKDIGFKGVSKDFSEENKPSFYTKDLEAAKYYSGLREGTQTISAVFDFKNPLIINAEKPAPIPIVTPDGETLGTFNDKDINEKIISAGYDGLVLNRKFSTPLDGWEILSFDNNTRHILGTDFDIEKFKEFVSKNENNISILNDWDKKYLEKGTLEIVKKIYSDFGQNLPKIILLPERGARPLFYLLNPIFKEIGKAKGINIPKFIYFSVSKKAGTNLGIFEQYNDVKTSSDLIKIMSEDYPDFPLETIQKLVDKEQVEDVMVARESMEKRATEIKNKISKEDIAIVDEVLSNGRTIEEIRRAFGDERIPAYTIVALNDGYAPLTESGYRFNEELDERNPNTKVKGYSFSFEQEEDAIGVSKSINSKYSIPIKKNTDSEEKELWKKKKNLRDELTNTGMDISKKVFV